MNDGAMGKLDAQLEVLEEMRGSLDYPANFSRPVRSHMGVSFARFIALIAL